MSAKRKKDKATAKVSNIFLLSLGCCLLPGKMIAKMIVTGFYYCCAAGTYSGSREACVVL
jgi:hypothetical protein